MPGLRWTHVRNRKWGFYTCDFNQLSVNIFFSWPLTFESSLLRLFAITRTPRVDDKVLPVSGLSPAHCSMPLSACHSPCLLWTDSRSIHHSRISRVWWCFGLCSHPRILCTHVFCFFFISVRHWSLPLTVERGHLMKTEADKQWYWILAWLFSSGGRFVSISWEKQDQHVINSKSALPPNPPNPTWLTLNWGRTILEKHCKKMYFAEWTKGFTTFTFLHAQKTHRKIGLDGKPVLQLINSQIIVLDCCLMVCLRHNLFFYAWFYHCCLVS